LLALKHTTEVKEIILFGKKPCIAIRIEEKKMHFILQILVWNKGYQIWHDTNTVPVSNLCYLSIYNI